MKDDRQTTSARRLVRLTVSLRSLSGRHGSSPVTWPLIASLITPSANSASIIRGQWLCYRSRMHCMPPTACRQVHQRTIGATTRIPIYAGIKSVGNDIFSTPGCGAGLSNAPSWAERLPESAELLVEEDGELPDAGSSCLRPCGLPNCPTSWTEASLSEKKHRCWRGPTKVAAERRREARTLRRWSHSPRYDQQSRCLMQ